MEKCIYCTYKEGVVSNIENPYTRFASEALSKTILIVWVTFSISFKYYHLISTMKKTNIIVYAVSFWPVTVM